MDILSNRRPKLGTLVFMAGLSALSMNLILPSLPAMAHHFNTEYSTIQLAISGYMACNAMLLLVIGPVSDWLGRRPVMLFAAVVYVLASVGCILSPNIHVFLLCRTLQSAIAAGIVLSRAVVRDISSPQQAAVLVSYVATGMALMPMLSPTLGGALQQLFGWKANLAFMGGAGLVLLVVCWFNLHETNVSRTANFSKQVRLYGEVATSSGFWAYALTGALAGGIPYAFYGGAPFVANKLLNLSPQEMGYWFASSPAGYMLGSFTSARLTLRFGLNRLITAGCTIVLVAIAIAIVAFSVGLGSPAALFLPMIGAGFGNGLALSNATAGSLAVPSHLAGTAAGLGAACAVGYCAISAAAPGLVLGEITSATAFLWVLFGLALLPFPTIIWAVLLSRRKPVRG